MQYFNLRRVASVFALIVFALLLFTMFGMGYNSITNDFSLGDGFNRLMTLAGGLKSFGAMMIIAIAAVIVITGLHYMSEHDYTGETRKQRFHIALGLGVIFIAMYVGGSWFHWPSQIGWMAAGFAALSAIVTAAAIRLSHIN